MEWHTIDELPKLDKLGRSTDVLVCFGKYYRDYAVAYFNGIDWQETTDHWVLENVTHWTYIKGPEE